MLKRTLQRLHALRNYQKLPAIAKSEHNRDRKGLPAEDPGIDAVIEEGVAWLARAQDNSLLGDGGVARYYSLLSGWSSSYPETTGYIIPTLVEYSKRTGDTAIFQRAKRMLDWLLSIQLPGGGFQGGLIDSQPVVPVTFNTGSILLGLACGARELGGEYHRAMCAAADWLVNTQDEDGCWRKHPSPFAKPGEKAYDAHVAWGLFEAARLEPGRGYGAAGLASVRWALGLQLENGWFQQCCLSDVNRPTTHTIGCALRGVLEAYGYSHNSEFLDLGRKTADGLLSAVDLENGFLAGRVDSEWNGVVPWVCCTGTVQIAHCFLMLYQEIGDNKYRDAGFALNRFVRRTVKTAGEEEMRGAVKGSFPIYGEYGPYRFINPKFSIDSNLLEQKIRNGRPPENPC